MLNFYERVFCEDRRTPVEREIADYDDSKVDYDKDRSLALKHAPTSNRAHAAVVRHLARMLKKADHPAAEAAARVDPRNPRHLQMMVDVANSAAKTHDPGFYAYKPHMVHGALRHGASGGWAKNDDVFYLHTKRGGTSSVHDPYGEVHRLVGDNHPIWPHPWEGLHRQPLATKTLKSAILGKGRAAERVKRITTPRGGIDPSVSKSPTSIKRDTMSLLK